MTGYSFPLTNDGWFELKFVLGNNIIIQAVAIRISKNRITSHHKNHKVDEAKATGSVEITSKLFLQNLSIKKYS